MSDTESGRTANTTSTLPQAPPEPDPSVLTTAALLREVASLKELVFTRIDAIDKAITVAHDDLVRVPTEVQKTVGNLRDLHDQRFEAVEKELEYRTTLYNEKFASVQTQFRERDTRVEQTAKDNKVAVDAALSAAKEAFGEQNKSSALAIAKSETSIAKQIDSLVALITTATKALDDKITDAKDRLTRLEGKGEGTQDHKDYMFLVIGALIGLAGLAFAVFK